MLEPTPTQQRPAAPAYPLREKWVRDVGAYFKEAMPDPDRLEHQKPTSNEVGMRKRQGTALGL